MRQFWADWNVEQWKSARVHPILVLLVDLYSFYSFYFPFFVLFIPMLLCPYDLETSEERVTVFLLLVMGLMIALLIVIQPHYVAIFVGVIYLRFLHSFMRLRLWRPAGKPVGWILGAVMIGLVVGDFVYETLGTIRNFHESPRHSVIRALQKEPGEHVVILRYAPDHNPHDEWVYNRADIDASPIVWAREMGPDQDRPFMEYFRNRKVWVLEPDQSPPKLSPYPRETNSQ
jgi:hypothetical protein